MIEVVYESGTMQPLVTIDGRTYRIQCTLEGAQGTPEAKVVLGHVFEARLVQALQYVGNQDVPLNSLEEYRCAVEDARVTIAYLTKGEYMPPSIAKIEETP